MKKTGYQLLGLAVGLVPLACNHIDDRNGADPALVTIGPEDLLGGFATSTSSGVTRKESRLRKTISGPGKEADVDRLELSGGKSSGVRTLMATQLREGDPLTIEVSTRVDAGNLGMVLISPSKKILHTFKVPGEGSVRVVAKDAGVYEVRMGAESFSGHIEARRLFE